MELLCSLLVSGVFVVMLAILLEGVLAVGRKPAWEAVAANMPSNGSEAPGVEPAEPVQPELALVHPVDRRKQNLPFVGADRRKANARPQGGVAKAS